ncbi:unnamed protein product [Vitrella brassicaformis CCMP3155]|uniref:VPS9 domain-containing protein n=2 Tax=Vitrella brassicaformis TaxID=1169539 RepID=A0A0G4GWY7_VITBC|nr:unnamed protein product [Vitrella brassicaformis CCMP3155]|eukprot:CEM35484.1 unnamed protein product [Vitrella brassicaformis CCMP3155]
MGNILPKRKNKKWGWPRPCKEYIDKLKRRCHAPHQSSSLNARALHTSSWREYLERKWTARSIVECTPYAEALWVSAALAASQFAAGLAMALESGRVWCGMMTPADFCMQVMLAWISCMAHPIHQLMQAASDDILTLVQRHERAKIIVTSEKKEEAGQQEAGERRRFLDRLVGRVKGHLAVMHGAFLRLYASSFPFHLTTGKKDRAMRVLVSYFFTTPGGRKVVSLYREAYLSEDEKTQETLQQASCLFTSPEACGVDPHFCVPPSSPGPAPPLWQDIVASPLPLLTPHIPHAYAHQKSLAASICSQDTSPLMRKNWRRNKVFVRPRADSHLRKNLLSPVVAPQSAAAAPAAGGAGGGVGVKRHAPPAPPHSGIALPFANAIWLLGTLSHLDTPGQKLAALQGVARQIEVDVQEARRTEGGSSDNMLTAASATRLIDADNLVPLFAFMLCWSAPSTIVSDCALMTSFVTESQNKSEEGYLRSTLWAALEWIRSEVRTHFSNPHAVA